MWRVDIFIKNTKYAILQEFFSRYSSCFMGADRGMEKDDKACGLQSLSECGYKRS
jgi:hypothetical protein